MRLMKTRRGSWSLLQKGEEAGGRGSRKPGLREDTQLLSVCQGGQVQGPIFPCIGCQISAINGLCVGRPVIR